MIEKLYSIFLRHPVVSTDTRAIQPNSIFFALKGENFNGNQFAEKAIEMGCACAIIDEAQYKKNDNYFLVEDVLTALQQLANYHRKQLKLPVIAITGSNGKTTTKELINAVLSKKYSVSATEGNLNNHIGVPLTLLKITSKHEVAIVEMGANHQGEIASLCEIAEPEYGIITNIGKAHLEGFGGIEGVKKGKSELYKFIREKKGKVFVHADDPVLTELSGNIETITYGTKKIYDIIGEMSQTKEEYLSFRWASRDSGVKINESPLLSTNLVGVYNFYNLLCAVCVGHSLKVDTRTINQALAEYLPSNKRSQLHKTKSNTLILDYYNANPSSMTLAIENFAELNQSNKIVVLGDMLELGDESEKEHDAIVRLLQQKNISNMYLVGPYFMQSGKKINAKTFASSDELLQYFREQPIKDAIILIKGSRGIKLEKVVEVL